MGQYVADIRFAAHRGDEVTTREWEVIHHIEHPIGTGQPKHAKIALTPAQEASLAAALAASTVDAWVAAEIPAAWGWGAAEAAHLALCCADCGW